MKINIGNNFQPQFAAEFSMLEAVIQPPSSSRPVWAEISLPNLLHNYRTIKKYLHGQAQLMAVVKANAYGHGAVTCARALELDVNADWFGVALIEEGV